MARIHDEVIERLKEEVDLAELVVRSGVALSSTGKDLVGRCPFHDDDTPSLVVTPSKGLWHCMGACQAGGTVIDWVMRSEGVSFRHAVELLRSGATRSSSAGPGRSGWRPSGASRPRSPPTPTTPRSWPRSSPTTTGPCSTPPRPSPTSPAARSTTRRRSSPSGSALPTGPSGCRLPAKQTKAGAAFRGRLQRLGVYRNRATSTWPARSCPGHRHRRAGHRPLRPQAPQRPAPGHAHHLYLPGPHRGVWNEAGLAGGEVIVCRVAHRRADASGAAGFTNVTAAYGTAGLHRRSPRGLRPPRGHPCPHRLRPRPGRGHGGRGLGPELMASGVECFRVALPLQPT